MSNIKLFGTYTSPFVRHCRLVLAQTATDYTLVETDYADSNKGSPTKRVPYLHDGATQLHDSAAIIQYIRQQNGQAFLPTAAETELFALANTVLDTTVNLFLLEKSGISDPDNPFLQRQQGRIDSGLAALDAALPTQPTFETMNDAHWRAACLLDWGLFRQRFALNNTPNLRAFLNYVQTWEIYKATAPFVSDN